MNCNFYKTTCKNCNHEFTYPLLNDFAYGEFIFSGSDGISFRYLNAFESEVWGDISAIIKSNGLSELDKNDSDVDAFQKIVGSAIEVVNGISFQLEGICPNCKSCDLVYSDNKMIENRDVPIASFTSFLRLTEPEKVKLVISRWNEFNAR